MSLEGAGAPSGQALHDLIRKLYPICRSITGAGVRETLDVLKGDVFGGGRFPLVLHEVPSGTSVFDWTVPKEWTIREAWIRDPQGQTVVDFGTSNLHVLNYSGPIDATVSLDELRKHIHTLPDQPELIPYRTSYYARTWGFCMAHNDLEALEDGDYRVYIDAEHRDGSLTYGEWVLPGASEEEVLISTHICHPSMCNDNLSGVVVARALAEVLNQAGRRYTYRFLFIPGTIGSITWLARNPQASAKIKHGLVLAGLGDPGAPHYKKSQRENAFIDLAVGHVLKTESQAHGIEDFSPYGYDERQFCSPGFDLPVGCFSRTPHGQYPEYHTSGDDLDFVTPDALADSLRLLLSTIEILEGDITYRNLEPHCEPQLGKRGLYDNVGGRRTDHEDRMAILWVLNQSDGSRSLFDIARRSGVSFGKISWAADALNDAGLLEVVS